jgi:4-carboxymuconolactone decarboxylase
VGRIRGITERRLTDLSDFEESPAFSELEKRVLRFAEALSRTPANVSEELFNSLREHFDPRQMVELTAAIAWENSRARFNRGFDIAAEGFSEGAVCPVHTLAGTTRNGTGQSAFH